MSFWISICILWNSSYSCYSNGVFLYLVDFTLNICFIQMMSNLVEISIFDCITFISLFCLQEKSPRLWAFLIAVYWVSFVTYFLLWKAYKHVSWLRADALMSSEAKVEQFAILVRDIPAVPEGQSKKEMVDSFFRTIYPDTFYRSMLVTDNKKVFHTVAYFFMAFV